MRKALAVFHRLAMAALALAPVMLLLGHLLAGNWLRPARWMLGVSALALLTAFLPGSLPAGGRTFPLRVAAALGLAAGIVAAFLLIPPLFDADVHPIRKWLCALIFAAFFLILLREITSKAPLLGRVSGLAIGLCAYLAAGIAVWALKLWELNAALYVCAAAFLLLSAFSLNHESLDVGYASHQATKPPARMLRANRLLLALLIAIVAFVAAFDRVRQWVSVGVLSAVRAVARFFLWLLSLMPAGQEETGGVQGGEMGFMPQAESTEPHIIWQILFYVVLALAICLVAFLLYKGLRVLARKLRALLKSIAAYFKRFAQAVGEDYVDERESLFDSAELRRSVEDRLRRGIRRFTQREKRWERMDARERVRFVVRTLYRRSGDSVANLPSLTVREAAQRLNTGQADPETLADLYDRARYGEGPIDEDEAEALRKAVKP